MKRNGRSAKRVVKSRPHSPSLGWAAVGSSWMYKSGRTGSPLEMLVHACSKCKGAMVCLQLRCIGCGGIWGVRSLIASHVCVRGGFHADLGFGPCRFDFGSGLGMRESFLRRLFCMWDWRPIVFLNGVF